MMRRKMMIPIVAVLAIALVITTIVVWQRSKLDPAVAEATELYLESVKMQDFETLDKLLYFGERYEGWREPIYQNIKSDTLLAYKIQEYKKLGTDIYQVNIKMDTRMESDTAVENYVVRIDGEWKYAANPRNVPQDIYVFDEYDDTVLVTDDEA